MPELRQNSGAVREFESMIRYINGEPWFCCPKCGKKIHPVKPGARGVYAICKNRLPDGTRCNWRGEIKWNKTF